MDLKETALMLLLGYHECERCGVLNDSVSYVEEPYQADINGIHVMVWYCPTCHQDSCDDI